MDLKPLKQLNALYVEDDPVIGESMRRTLELFFNRVYLAPDGRKARYMLQGLKIDVAFLDIRLPDTDGLTLAGEIREADIDIPIVVMSSYQDMDDLRKAVSLYLVEYLVKPVSLEVLRNVLGKCVTQLNQRGRLHTSIGDGAIYDAADKSIRNPAGEKIKLSRREALFMELLLKRPGVLVPLERIEARVYDDDMSFSALRNMVLRLRRKLIDGDRIESVKELGYLWRQDV